MSRNVNSFKEKYGMELEDFKRTLHKEKGNEIFEKEEDLEDWEFVTHAVKWWKEKTHELGDCKTR